MIAISEHLQIECDEAFILTIPCLVLFEAKSRGTVRNARGTSRCYCDVASWNRHTTSFVMNGKRKVPRRCKTLQCRKNYTEERLYTRNVCVFFFFSSKPFLTIFDIYFYINPIRYTTSFLDFPRLGTCTEVGTGYETRWA